MNSIIKYSFLLTLLLCSCATSDRSQLDPELESALAEDCNTMRHMYEQSRTPDQSQHTLPDPPLVPDFVSLRKITKGITPWTPQELGGGIWDTIASTGQEMIHLLESQRGKGPRLGPALEANVIQLDYSTDKWIMLYADPRLDEDALGYWVGISDDEGDTWRSYYTGLTENYGVFAKRQSRLPLLRDSQNIQFEAVLRVTDESTIFHPQSRPIERTVLEDSLVVEIPIKVLVRDSDADGLTDIVEAKMMLNPHLTDTDGDGVDDPWDPNPHFPPSDSIRSRIYELVIDHPETEWRWPVYLSEYLDSKKRSADSSGSTKKYDKPLLLVTDDPALLQAHPKSEQLILVTSREYQNRRLLFPHPLRRIYLGEMIPCEEYPGKFALDYTKYSFSSSTFYVVQLATDWVVVLVRMIVA